MELDYKDKMILTLLAQNPHLSQYEIAEEIGVSQPSVAMRIEKLKKKKIMENQIGVNPLTMGMFIAKVDISTRDPASILEMFEHCPYFINGFTMFGKVNLCLFFVSENVNAIDALVNSHIRSLESVDDMSYNLILNAKKNFNVPIEFIHDNCDLPPCSDDDVCKDCTYFVSEKCLGCPSTGENKGWNQKTQ